MSYFRDVVYKEIVRNSENHAMGYFNCIPFENLDVLEGLIPGVEQDTYYILTANSGVGKSKLCRSLFIHQPWMYVRNHPEYDIKLEIFYFSLEESKKKVVLSEISKYLYKTYGKIISIKQLQSRGRYNFMDKETLEQISEAEDYVNAFLETVRIIDNVRSPTAIFEYMRNHAAEIGIFYDRFGRPLSDEDQKLIKKGDPKTLSKIGGYRKKHSKHYVIVITDHVSLLSPETVGGKTLTQWQTISKFSNEYCISLRDKYGFTVVNVQQQASAKEQVEYNYKGQTIQEKLEPSLDGLGDNKTTQRDANIILGLFSPFRYGIEEHGGYDILFWRNYYRSLSILKDRDGSSDGVVPMYFNGAVDEFKELPDMGDAAALGSLMREVNNIRRERGEHG